MGDPRMIAVVATAWGKDLQDAMTVVVHRLRKFYGDGEILLAELRREYNSNKEEGPLGVNVVATGYHRPGQLLRCSMNNHEDTLVPYDAPCIVPQPAHGSSFILAEPRKPDSVVGMHRGSYVYIQSNDRWVKTHVPDVDVIHVHNEGYWKP